MPYIGNTPALDYISYAVQNFTVTAGTTVYTLDYSVANENDIRLVINNVIQRPGASYAYSATGTTLTLTSATLSTDTMYAVFIGRAVQTVTPPTNSVGLSQLTATGTKDSTTFLRGDNTFSVPAGGFKSMQVFSTSGSHTYTKPSGIKLIKVYITGGGGGGGKGGASEIAGGGGAAGGTAIKVINATSITTETVTIGAGGASENAGSTSSFGSHCSATGGQQGLNAGALSGQSLAGVGSSGDINLYGQAGGGGSDNTSAQTGGLGGSSFWGGGGYGIYNTTGLVGYHGGGGGGGQRSTANIGGAGGAGICVVEEYT